MLLFHRIGFLLLHDVIFTRFAILIKNGFTWLSNEIMIIVYIINYNIKLCIYATDEFLEAKLNSIYFPNKRVTNDVNLVFTIGGTYV